MGSLWIIVATSLVVAWPMGPPKRVMLLRISRREPITSLSTTLRTRSPWPARRIRSKRARNELIEFCSGKLNSSGLGCSEIL